MADLLECQTLQTLIKLIRYELFNQSLHDMLRDLCSDIYGLYNVCQSFVRYLFCTCLALRRATRFCFLKGPFLSSFYWSHISLQCFLGVLDQLSHLEICSVFLFLRYYSINRKKSYQRIHLKNANVPVVRMSVFVHGWLLSTPVMKQSITKTRLFKYKENFTSKNWKFSAKKLWYFFIFLLKT